MQIQIYPSLPPRYTPSHFGLADWIRHARIASTLANKNATAGVHFHFIGQGISVVFISVEPKLTSLPYPLRKYN